MKQMRKVAGGINVLVVVLALIGLFQAVPTAVQAQDPPTAIVVTSDADSGPGTLRQALADVADGGTITFAGDMTIRVESTLQVTRSMTINGGDHHIVINGDSDSDGDGDVTIFSVSGATTASFVNLTIERGSGGATGGIWNGATTVVTGCTFLNNAAGGGSYSGGGAIHNSYNYPPNRTLIVANSYFQGNTSGDYGGAIRVDTGTATVVNSTFVNNSAVYYGGALESKGTLTVINSTFSGNNSSWGGGAIYHEGTPVTVRNSVFARGTSGANCSGFGSYGGGNNLSDDGTCPGIADPAGVLLGAPGNYGGSTPTMPLLPGSAAIDGADPAYCPALDQRGMSRVGTCDIGAYESRGFSMALSGGDYQDAPVNTAFAEPLAVTVASAHGELVQGGRVTFAGPASGASTAPATFAAAIDAGGVASATATANYVVGPYEVLASAGGLSVTFHLTNTGASYILAVSGGDGQHAGIALPFADPLAVTLTDAAGAPVAGETIAFAAPTSGASTVPAAFTATTDAGGVATATVSANDLAGGPYEVVVSAGGLSVIFHLTNTSCPPNSVVVTNADDSGPGSLRDAIVWTCAGGTITFDNDYTIHLASELDLPRNITIDGGAHRVTVSGDSYRRVFDVWAGATLQNLTIVNGYASYPGGGGIYNAGTLALTNCTLSGHYGYRGGAIYNDGTLTVVNSTFSGNRALYGGGIFNAYLQTATLVNCTFSGNRGTAGASGVHNQYGASTISSNTIIAGSPFSSGPNCYKESGGTFVGGNNLASDGTCGLSFTNSPTILLGTLGDYGGQMQTVPLLPSSVALDAGDPVYCPLTDQRGAERVGTCDIGAFESQGFALGSLTGTPQSALLNTAFAEPLGLAVTANDPVEPVDGGRVTFTPPADGASADIAGSPATIAGGVAGVTVTANGTPGSYDVTASAAGAASVAFALTNDPVDTTLDDTPADPSFGGVTFAFSANAPAATFECRLDAGEWGACTSPKVYLVLAAAQHTFEVRAADAFGSTDETPASYTWNVAAVALAPAGIVAPGSYHTCALKPDGAIECWGDNTDGQATSQSGPFTQVSAGNSHTCGLTPDGAVDCWGSNSAGQAGGLHTGLSPYTQVAPRMYHTCALTAGGAVDCWGNNSYGQAHHQDGPFTQVCAGQYHTCGLTPEGAIDCWGLNDYGQADHRDGPYTEISAGARHTCGLKPDGAIECWGMNYDGEATSQSGPYVKVTAGWTHTCALTPSGAVDCWGSNYAGQAADQMSAYTQVAAGTNHTCALTPGGAVTCWGYDLGGAGGYHEGPYGAYVPTPILAAINPASAPAGSGELSLTVAGSGFAGSSMVRWNGSDLATTYAGDTELTAVVPAGSLAAVGTAQVTVHTPAPGGGTSSVLAFFVTEAAAGVVEQQVSSGTDPSASVAPASASATGDGLLAVAQYDANPGGTPSFNASGTYFDVYVAPGNSFSQVSIMACGLNPGDKLYWWDVGNDKWEKAGPQSYDAGTGCITLTVDANSSPSLGQLQGTYFATGTNTAPIAQAGGPYLGPINSAISFDGSGSHDPDGDPLTYAWDFGDGGTTTEAMPAHSYAEAWVYDVCLTVNDGVADSDAACTMAVVYDPSAGFVTGGGWIDSPAGAYLPDPELSGKATFGFVSRYQKGAQVPTGNTEFQFHVAGFNFHSETYEWLVVNQSGTNAQFKGSGTVNGGLDPNGNEFKFMIWAGDSAPDTFRIKIWWEAGGVEYDVYDNGTDQAIGGGSIVVHTK